MASISAPKASRSSADSTGVGVGLVMASLLVGCGSEVDGDVADGGAHADLDVFGAGARRLAAVHVADHAVVLAPGAGVADAHAAAVLGAEPGVLRLFQQGAAVVVHRLGTADEGEGAADLGGVDRHGGAR